MKNMVVIQKDEDGKIYCSQISEKGKEFHLTLTEESDEGYWEKGGTIVLEELEEILDREV